MLALCAWCGKTISGEASAEAPRAVSHGICNQCLLHVVGEKGRTLTRFLESLEHPVLVVLPDGAVAASNGKARELLGKDAAQIEGFLTGTVFECVHAQSPGGCGTTKHCSGCSIRLAIGETAETGRSKHGIPVVLVRASEDGDQRQRMEFSTQRVENVVMVRIDSVGEPKR